MAEAVLLVTSWLRVAAERPGAQQHNIGPQAVAITRYIVAASRTEIPVRCETPGV